MSSLTSALVTARPRFPLSYLAHSLRARRAGKRWYHDNPSKRAREAAGGERDRIRPRAGGPPGICSLRTDNGAA